MVGTSWGVHVGWGAGRVGVWCVGGFPSSLVESAEIKGGVKCWNLLRLFCQRQQHL